MQETTIKLTEFSIEDVFNMRNKIEALEKEKEELTEKLKKETQYKEMYSRNSDEKEKIIKETHALFNALGVAKSIKNEYGYPSEIELNLNSRLTIFINELRKGN